ncbi:CHC2 zinc finger domain-containing protein [Sphingobium sp. DEHP117]|uniref:DUF7146 domain-containing protein n=1 Tax=Sphingobium sp. DEHP117 TaxID=2993436 RepID=UPI0027D70A31|nr:CHC2 zinc finger domain-containing protein [Sphingobium sp. DEHP117]MDQ4419946.1 CHC2 zinc finger domain-containing protein [Sphingobium sp. DEHP117]
MTANPFTTFAERYASQLPKRQKLDLDAIRRANPLPSIVAAGVKLQRAGDEWKGCCPFHPDRSPSFTIYLDGKSGHWKGHCFAGCFHGDVLDYVQRIHGVGLVEVAELLEGGQLPVISVPVAHSARTREASRTAEAQALWEQAIPATGTLAETYLRSRGIISPIPPSIRYAHISPGKGPQRPTLVAKVSDSQDSLIGLQRTFLSQNGASKAAMTKPKLSLGKIAGGAIRLGALDESATLTVCEGLEDGLTLAQELGGPVWVAAGASMLPSMQFPDCVRSIVIGEDNDEAGTVAANKAASAFTARGLTVRIIRPLDGYKDFNAELMGVRS